MDTNQSEEIPFGTLLRQFRKRRRWSQKQLGDKIGASREAVSFWELGDYKPETDTTLYELAHKLGLTEQEKRQLFEAYTVTALATSFHNSPFERSPYFTGRSAELKQLHTLLRAGKQGAMTLSITGLGGIGKTQLALEYAYQHEKSYHDIFWVNAEKEELWMTSYVHLAGLLHLPEYEEADQNKAKDAVYRWLRKHTNWLLILDNVEDFHLLQSFVPNDRKGAVLLTTRRQVIIPVAQSIELELFPENDAVRFLLKRTKALVVDQSLEEDSEHDIEAAKAVTRLLGNLPLALDQAGAYILETPCSFAEYLALFPTYRGQLLQRRIGEHMPTDHPESVTTTFTLNFGQAQQRNPAAGELLRFLAFLAPEAIPEEIIAAGASSLGSVLAPVAADAFQRNQAIETLYAYSLARRDLKEKTLSIHRLVQAVLKDTVEETERRILAKQVIIAVNAAFPHVEHKAWSQCERLLPQALSVVQGIEENQAMSKEAGRLLYETASYLDVRARYAVAEPLYQQSIHIREQVLGETHPHVTHPLNKLAALYEGQGKYAEAEPLLWRSLHIAEQQVESEHADVAYPLIGLANLYSDQGKYAEAEPLYQRALLIAEQQLGPEHPFVAYSLNSLAILYREQGKYSEAEALYKRVLHIRELLGPEHPDVADPLHNLAALYYDQGKYGDAEPLYQRALLIYEQQLGPEHPQVAYPLDGLAALYSDQDRYEEAEPLYQRALHIWELLGPEHPNVAVLLYNLANLYSNQGKYPEAEPLYQRALRIRELLASKDPHIADPLNGLANLYRDQGRYAEAEPLYQRALHIWEQLEPEHAQVAYTLYNLANFYRDQGKYAEAKPLYQRALRIAELQLGPKHPGTAEVIHDLARFWEMQSRIEKAEALYTRVLAIREQALGAHHRKTTETRMRLTLLRTAGKLKEATQLEDNPE